MSYGKKLNNRIIITSIRIKNFRSIKNALIKVKDMNIFVGLNDVGKSNVLKAYCRSYQTLKEHPNIDFSQVYILVRLYEVNDDEDIVKDITYATNSQNPIDFRDLKSNDSIQILLETSAADLVNIFLHI